MEGSGGVDRKGRSSGHLPVGDEDSSHTGSIHSIHRGPLGFRHVTALWGEQADLAFKEASGVEGGGMPVKERSL